MTESGGSTWRKPACAVLILAYFLYFNSNALWAHFAADDMMNMASYWKMAPARLVLLLVMPWVGVRRRG